MIYLYFIILLLLLITSFIINKKDYISPAFIFTFGFFFQGIWVLLFHKQWNLDMHLNTFLVITLGVAEFILVNYLVKMFFKKKYKDSDKTNIVLKPIRISYILEVLFFIFILCAGAVYLYYVVRAVHGNFSSIGAIKNAISAYDSLTKFSDDIDKLPFIVNNINFAVVAAGYWFLYVVINNFLAEKRVRAIEILITLGAIASSMLCGSRTPVFMMIVAGVSYYFVLYFKKKNYQNIFKKKTFIIVACLGVSFILLFAPLAKLLGREVKMGSFEYLSIYCGAQVKNLDSFLQENNYLFKNEFLGSQTFHSALQTVGSKLPFLGVNEYRMDLPFRRVNGIELGNVYTTFYAFIYDFGYLGLFVLVLIMGLISGFVYEHIIRMKNLDKIKMSILIYGVIFGCLALSFFSDKFYEDIFSMGFVKKIIIWSFYTLVFCKINYREILNKLFRKRKEKAELKKKNIGKNKSVKRNYIYNVLYQMLVVILPVITTPYLARRLGAEGIGTYGYTISMATYFILFGSLGINMYGQREIAYNQDDKEKRSKVFFELFIFKCLTMLVSTIVFFIFFCINREYSIYYKILLIELFANMIDISWFYQGMEEFKKTVIRNTIVKVIGLACIFIFIKQPSDLYKYILLYVGCNLLGNLTLWFDIDKYLVKPKKINIFKQFPMIIALFIPQIAIQVYTLLDKTMLGRLTHNMTQVGNYEESQKIIKTILVFVTALGTVVSSRISKTASDGDHEKVVDYLKKSYNFVWFLGFPLMTGLIATAKTIVPWFLGKEFNDSIVLIMIGAVLIMAIGLNNVSGVQYLIPVKKQNLFTKSVIIGAVFNFCMNFVLIPKFGAVGAIVSSVLAEILIIIVQAIDVRKDYNLRIIFHGSYKYIIGSIIMFIPVYIMGMYLKPTIYTTLSQVFVGMAIYALYLLIIKDSFAMYAIGSVLSRFGGKLGCKLKSLLKKQ